MMRPARRFRHCHYGSRLHGPLSLTAAFACALVSAHSHGADWKFATSIAGNATLSDNINLAPTGQEKTDLALSVSPSFSANLDGARLKVRANYTPTIYKYAQTSDNDYIANSLNAIANLEAVQEFLFVDAIAQVTQTFLSPFGPQPTDGANNTNNRSENRMLGLSPYIKHTTGSGITYVVRDDNTYTTSDSGSFNNIYANQLSAKVDGPLQRGLQWGADYNYGYTKFEDRQTFRSQLARLRLSAPITYDFGISASGGYEKNNYTLEQNSGPIYGAGLNWRPSPRTNLNAFWEHRFFGSSYTAAFDHRTRLTAWSLQGSRNVQTYFDPLALAPGSTSTILNSIFQARIPDPIKRQQAVDAFMRQAGLPPALSSPVTLYANQISLVESISGSFALIGARNSLVFNAFWSDTKPLSGSGLSLPDSVLAVDQLTQTGGSATFNHKITDPTSLGIAVQRVNSKSPGAVGSVGAVDSKQTTYSTSLNHQFSPKTSGSVTLRYQTFNSSVSSSYKEHALLAGILHYF